MSEMPAPNEAWLRTLSDHGIAILIVLVLLFTVLPACGYAAWKVFGWLASRGDKVLDGHFHFLDRTASAIEAIKELTSTNSARGEEWHDEKVGKLDAIQNGVVGLHTKVDDMRNHVIKNSNKGNET